MSADDLLKILIGVVSAFAGWLLAQLTSSLKAWLHRLRIRKLLLEELSDLDVEVQRLLTFYARQLQIHGAMGVSSETVAGLSNPIFCGYYKDALLSLNQKQRVSFQLIHSLVDLVNAGIVDLRQKASEIYARNAREGMNDDLAKVCEAWGKAAKAQFLSASGLRWQIHFHLANKSGPNLSYNTNAHKEYLRYMQEASDKGASFVANGKTIERRKFDQIYDPSDSIGTPP